MNALDLNFIIRVRNPDEEDVEECKAHGVGINAWTVNGMEGLEKLVEWDCEGIITNYPDVPVKYSSKEQ